MRMRTLCLYLVACALAIAGGPQNTVTITEQSGSSQADRPFSISRVFAEGEISDYPRPVVDGTAETTWQSDVKTRWRDGRVTRTITGASNEEPITITSAGHGFLTGEMVTIGDVEGNTAANGTWRIIRISRDAFSLTGSSGNGAYTSGGTATGPDLGSVQHAIVSFTESFTADQSKTLTFQNSENPCSSGNQAACDAAGLDESEMLAFNLSSWGASIEAETPDGDDTTRSASARTIIDDANFEYWLRGPVVTEVIAEDRTSTRSYDFGWSCTANCSGDYSSSTWEDETTYRPLHPRFILTFYAGWAGVKVDYILENIWTVQMADQYYTATLQSGASLETTEYTFSSDTLHTDRSRWHKVYWDGDEPGKVEIDRNIDYMIYSKVLPMYDIAKDPVAGDIAAEVAYLEGKTYTPLSGYGPWFADMNSPGGRPDLGYLPRWDVNLLFSGFDADLEEQVYNTADMAGHVALHFRSSDTDANQYFIDIDRDGSSQSDADDNVAGNTIFGRVFSIDARPTRNQVSYPQGWNCSGTCDGTRTFIDFDPSHHPAFVTVAYLLSGNYYYLEELWYWAAYSTGYDNPSLTNPGWRHGSWGIINAQVRGTAWGLRNVVHAAYFSPDDYIEKEYFRHKVETTIGAFEGYGQNIGGLNYRKLTNAPDSDPCPSVGGTNNGKSYSAYVASSYDPAVSTPYCWGYATQRTINGDGDNPLQYLHIGNDGAQSGFSGTVTSPWMENYLRIVLGASAELGFPSKTWLRSSSNMVLNMLDRRDEFNPRAYGEGYRRPFKDGDGNFFRDWEGFYNDYPDAYKEDDNWSTFGDSEHGYGFITNAALSFMTEFADGTAQGWEAWDYMTDPEETNSNVRTYLMTWGANEGHYDYKWAMVPRHEPTAVHDVEPGDTFLILRYVAPTTSACAITVDDDSAYGSPVVSGSDGLSTRAREYVVNGLSPSTPYYWRVHCADTYFGSGIVEGTVATTAPLTGTGSLRLVLGPGSSSVSVDYGPTMMLGNVATQPCADGCTVEVPDLQAGLYYLRVRRTAEESGLIKPAIIRQK